MSSLHELKESLKTLHSVDRVISGEPVRSYNYNKYISMKNKLAKDVMYYCRILKLTPEEFNKIKKEVVEN